MIRRAAAGEEARIDAFLALHADSSMFLRSNLAAHGLADRDQPLGTTYQLWLEGDQIRGVFGCTNEGFLMCQAPGADAKVWSGFLQGLAGRQVKGLSGDNAQVLDLLRQVPMGADQFALNHEEPLYRMDLCDLQVDSRLCLRAPQPYDIELLTFWNAAYVRETGLQTEDTAGKVAIARAVNNISSGRTRLLEVAGKPVAMTSFNARIADTVQVGGVFTPPELRGRGYGRQVVAAHLAEARAEGVATALLFSNNDAASRAYEAIGFNQVGRYRIAVLKQPFVIGAGDTGGPV